MQPNPRGGLAFDDEDVARAYVHRPPYPDALFTFLTGLPGQRRRALDLGCGTGKIAHRLAESFDHVDAVDPSSAMLRVADDGRHANIRWIHSLAETAPLAESYDLMTAGLSIHWMDHPILFARLAARLAPDGFIAVVEGDGAHDVPWQPEWEAFLARWLERLGAEYDPSGYQAQMSAYRHWIVIAGECTFEGRFSQTVDEFIECQHSRATWSRANLGADMTLEFDANLRDMLLPHAENEQLHYTTRTQVVWGRPVAERLQSDLD